MGLEGVTGASDCLHVYKKEDGSGRKESTSFVYEREEAECAALCTSGWKDGVKWARKGWVLESGCLGFNPGSVYSQLGKLDK